MEITEKLLLSPSGHKDCIFRGKKVIIRKQQFLDYPSEAYLHKWDIRTGKCLGKYNSKYHTVFHLSTLSNGKIVGVGQLVDAFRFSSVAIDVCIWCEVTGKLLKVKKFELIYSFFSLNKILLIRSLTPLSNGRVLFAYRKKIYNWNPETNDFLIISECCRITTTYLGILPNKNAVISLQDNFLQIWSTDTKECLHFLKGHNKQITCFSVLPNGHIVTASKDKTIRIWDSESGLCLQVLGSHKSDVNKISLLTNGNFVSCSDDNTAIIWKFRILRPTLKLLDSLDLSVYSNQAHPDAIVQRELINGLKQQTQSYKINLASSSFNEECMRMLSRGLKNNGMILQLNLSHCNINNKVIHYLAKALSSNLILRELNLQNNCFDDVGIAALATMLTKNK